MGDVLWVGSDSFLLDRKSTVILLANYWFARQFARAHLPGAWKAGLSLLPGVCCMPYCYCQRFPHRQASSVCDSCGDHWARLHSARQGEAHYDPKLFHRLIAAGGTFGLSDHPVEYI